jgi:hypothetical protein
MVFPLSSPFAAASLPAQPISIIGVGLIAPTRSG